ncbi:RING-finger-containing E3 ubiquitin ligase [Heliothis virescens ascovirus 3g]|uniref:RING-finger-containing E3 ubiquitin ligase n=1 Tax=Heliothis virescens ascovirus 3g TaxID=1246651 RepID=K4NYG2_9VIRU|nr:RING-finger-containing E3 ubiquitin ligase [Heliothis virescens ascovirus 3g]AFV50435.1 RING-finger-containing E3 ubiquitin ligase [Heliothis virescens ascovirus 3g]
MDNVCIVTRIFPKKWSCIITYFNNSEELVTARTNILQTRTFVDRRNGFRYLQVGVDKSGRILFDAIQIARLIVKTPCVAMAPMRNTRCAICLQNIRRSTERTYAHPDSCRHTFCSNCLKLWSEKHYTCPICRETYASVIRRRLVDSSIISEYVFRGPIKFMLLKLNGLQEVDVE